MNLQPDHSVDRIKRLVESEVWRKWCKENNKHSTPKHICPECFLVTSVQYNSGTTSTKPHFLHIKCGHSLRVHNFDWKNKNIYIIIPLEHQHRAILKDFGYTVVINEYCDGLDIYVTRVDIMHKNAVLEIEFNASTVEQALDMALIWALESRV